jgi:hypothetical protein
MRRSLPAAVLAVLLAATVGTACGAPPPPPPLPRYASVTDLGTAIGNQLKKDKTTKINLVQTMTGGDPQPNANVEQVLDYAPGGLSVQLDTRAQPPGAPAPLESTTVVLPDQAYVKPPPGFGLPAGKSWIRIPEDSPQPWMQQLIGQVRMVRQSADPTASFTEFGQAAAITESAEDTVNGTRAIRYKVRVDMAKAAEAQSDPALRDRMRSVPSVDTTLWLDAQNRLLRMLIQQPTGDGGTLSLDARYRDWGVPVDIRPPPPDQVVDS